MILAHIGCNAAEEFDERCVDMEKMVRITICIEPETERLIRLLSHRHARSISELVREAVEQHWGKSNAAESNPGVEATVPPHSNEYSDGSA